MDAPWDLARHVPPEELLAVLRQSATHAVVLLGDAALADLKPGAVAEAAWPHCVILVPERSPVRRIRAWNSAGLGHVADASSLRQAVSPCADGTCPRALDLPPCEWLPALPLPLSAGDEALQFLPRLRVAHSVAEWAREFGVVRQVLWEICVADLGVTPTTVLLLRIRAIAGRMRRQGAEIAEIAERLGFCSDASLCNAFRRRGWRLPPRGGRRGS